MDTLNKLASHTNPFWPKQESGLSMHVVAMGLHQSWVDNIQNLTLDNADAWRPGPYGGATSTLKGPMFAKLRVTQEARQEDKATQPTENEQKSD